MDVAATNLPSQCHVNSGSILGEAIKNFNDQNAPCRSALQTCLGSSVSSCADAVCNAGKDLLADACEQSGGSYCAGVMSSPGFNGSYSFPSFRLSTALCLPPGCGRSDIKAVSLHEIDQVCGEHAVDAECSFATDCDFELGIGNTFAIILGVLGTAACIFLFWYLLRRCQRKSRGPSATTQSLLEVAELDDDAPARRPGATYAVLSPEPDAQTEQTPASISYPVPTTQGTSYADAVKANRPSNNSSNGAQQYNSNARVGNDAVLESGASGL